MLPTLRLYESEEAAHDAAAMLVEKGFREETILLIKASAGADEETLRYAVAEELLAGSHLAVCARALEQGLSIVAVRAPFGRGQLAQQILHRFGPVGTDQIPTVGPSDPSPISDLLGIPTLTRYVPMTELKDSHWSLSSKLGLGLLSRGATPLSSLLGLKTLTAPRRPWTRSLGLPLLSRNPAPLSSLLRLKTLTAPKRDWFTSFGFPLLSKNPAPLSSLLGIPTLTRDRDRD